MQLEHLKKFKNVGDIYVIDNTPANERKPHPYPNIEIMDVAGIDGTTHGLALDRLVQKAKTDMICIQDSDFFWLDKQIFELAEAGYQRGYKNIGCAGFYPDWQANLDPKHPERAGHLAPVCWGMFVDRKLASEQTFCVTAAEAKEIHETGWRLRKRVIDEQIPSIIWEGFYPENWSDKECCFFREKEARVEGSPLGKLYPQVIEGVHLLKGSANRQGLTNSIPELLEKFIC